MCTGSEIFVWEYSLHTHQWRRNISTSGFSASGKPATSQQINRQSIRKLCSLFSTLYAMTVSYYMYAIWGAELFQRVDRCHAIHVDFKFAEQEHFQCLYSLIFSSETITCIRFPTQPSTMVYGQGAPRYDSDVIIQVLLNLDVRDTLAASSVRCTNLCLLLRTYDNKTLGLQSIQRSI